MRFYTIINSAENIRLLEKLGTAGCPSNFIEVILGVLQSQCNLSGETRNVYKFEGLLLASDHWEEIINIGENRNTGLSESGYDYINWVDLIESYVKCRYSGSLSKVMSPQAGPSGRAV
jgi:hypothetical protein